MSNELSDLILTICPHEQATAKQKNRVESMNSFFSERGACVEFEEINIKGDGTKTSMDYALCGSYKLKDINLAISAKTMSDFANSIESLPNELARGFLRFDEIGFVLVTGCYETTLSSESLHATIRNLAVPDGSADILNTTSMFNALESWQKENGIHCRQVLYETQFPQAVMSILNFITNEHHEGVSFNTKGVTDPVAKSKMRFVNAHIHLGVDGLGIKTVLKLFDYLVESNYPPNIHFAASIGESELQEAIGHKLGLALYEVYRCRDGWTEFKDRSKIKSLPPEYIKNVDDKVESKVNISELVKSPLNQPDIINGNISPKRAKQIIEENQAEISYLKKPICSFADEKNRDECKTKDNFKQHHNIETLLEYSSREETKQSISRFIKEHVDGVKIKDIYQKWKDSGLSEDCFYNIITELIQEGQCYEPKLGLIVPVGVNFTKVLKELQLSDVHDKPDNPVGDIIRTPAGSQSSDNTSIKVDTKADTLIQTKDSPMSAGNTSVGISEDESQPSKKDTVKEVRYDTKNANTQSDEQYILTNAALRSKQLLAKTSGAESPQTLQSSNTEQKGDATFAGAGTTAESPETKLKPNVLDKPEQVGVKPTPQGKETVGLSLSSGVQSLVPTDTVEGTILRHNAPTNPKPSTVPSNLEYKEVTPNRLTKADVMGIKRKLPDPPSNEKFKEEPRFKDVIEYIRFKPRSTDEVGKYFGFNPEYALKALYELKNKKKIWFELATLKWTFGLENNPMPVQSDVEMNVGV